MSIESNAIVQIMICCPFCGKDNVLPPVKPFSKIEMRPIRTGVFCSNCGKKFAYWKRQETSAHRNRAGVLVRRMCTYLKIPEVPRGTVIDNITIHCPICGEELVLAAPKPMSRLQLRPTRSDACCNVCGGNFIYWGRHEARRPPGVEARRYCIYLKIPILEEQRSLREHRVATEPRWFGGIPKV